MLPMDVIKIGQRLRNVTIFVYFWNLAMTLSKETGIICESLVGQININAFKA